MPAFDVFLKAEGRSSSSQLEATRQLACVGANDNLPGDNYCCPHALPLRAAEPSVGVPVALGLF